MQKLLITFILLVWASCGAWGQDVQSRMKDFLSGYTFPGNSRVHKATLQSFYIDEQHKQIEMMLGGGAEQCYWTEEIVNQVYTDLRNALPDSLQNYKLSVTTDNHTLDYHVPHAARSGKLEKSKRWKRTYEDTPWVTNLSRPYKIEKGLSGRHIALCQSHGKYYDTKKGDWVWQRPRLFCTTEDLYSQTFVIPYLIPMLENAGAIVYTPRDHFWQNEEVIVDNDDEIGGYYNEFGMDDLWEESEKPGFGYFQDTYSGHETPFGEGTSRQIKSVKKERDKAFAQWIPRIPKAGKYPVYVTYQSFKNSCEDVTYDIYHKGGVTQVSVNQKMGGGTWVYLGEYEFDAGMSDSGKVETTNVSKKKGTIVSADAVRFGGGMGNIERGGRISGLPRWAESAKFSCQWYGMPDSIYDTFHFEDEYRSDIYSRPKTVNELAGGSVYMPNRGGRNVPLEIYMAFHTDAGYSKSDNLIGPLSICTTDRNNGVYDSGMDRYSSHDLASLFLEGITRDMARYGYSGRGLWNKDYGESRAAEVPSIIFEMLSHQNFADMRLGYDPQFKFDLCRSFYKSILRFLCCMHDQTYVVQPLPVRNFAVRMDEDAQTAVLSWEPTYDELEPSATPTRYVVYQRIGRGGFDNGMVVDGTSCTISLSPDTIYSFQVCALNDGGRSFPSETLSCCQSSKNDGTVLIVNGFTRLEGPAWYNTESEQGFLLDKDPGVQYGSFAGFCGAQKVFTKSTMGSEAVTGLGYSGNELEGKVVMGNTFDYPYVHGEGILAMGNHSFTSMSVGAYQSDASTDSFPYTDMIFGVQKVFDSEVVEKLSRYHHQGGKLLVSGGNLLKSGDFDDRFGVRQAFASDSLQTGLSIGNEAGSFEIYRSLNDNCYCVPEPDVVLPIEADAQVIYHYDNGSPAGVQSGNVTVLGFPIEAIKEEEARRHMMKEVIELLGNQ